MDWAAREQLSRATATIVVTGTIRISPGLNVSKVTAPSPRLFNYPATMLTIGQSQVYQAWTPMGQKKGWK